MQTPSHLLITAVLARKSSNPTSIPVHMPALLIGSVVPDIPFVVLTVLYEIYYRWFAPFPGNATIMEYLHFELFYTDPVWLVGHNFFHSLVINGLFMGAGYLGIKRNWRWARPLFWFGVGTLFHTIIDIFTHHSDGPLLFFPLNWRYRFASPISYWEDDFYGREFMFFEFALDAFIIAYFTWQWLKRRFIIASN